MRVAQVLGHRQRAAGAHVLQCGIDRLVGAVALVGGGDVDGRLRNRNSGLGPADKFRRLVRGLRQHQRHRVRQAHVLGGADRNAARDEARILAGVNHLRQPVERRVRIAPAHGLDERADGVVVRIPVAVIHDGLLLDALLGNFHRDADGAIGLRRGGESRDFQRVERLARVAIGHAGQVLRGFLRNLDFEVADAALRIHQRAGQQVEQVILRNRLQLENLRARDERRVDEEERVVRGRADQPDDSALNIGQQHVLLRLVEAVDLVHEQHRGLAGVFEPVGRALQHPPHVGHVGLDPAEPLELALRLPGNHLRQRGFAGAGRPVEDQRLNPIGLNGAAQQHARREDVLLADVFVQIARSHALRERCGCRVRIRTRHFRRGGRGRLSKGEQIIARHEAKIIPERAAQSSKAGAAGAAVSASAPDQTRRAPPSRPAPPCRQPGGQVDREDRVMLAERGPVQGLLLIRRRAATQFIAPVAQAVQGGGAETGDGFAAGAPERKEIFHTRSLPAPMGHPLSA